MRCDQNAVTFGQKIFFSVNCENATAFFCLQIVIDWVTLWTAERFLQPVVSNGIKLEWFFAERVAEIDCQEIPPLLFSMAS